MQEQASTWPGVQTPLQSFLGPPAPQPSNAFGFPAQQFPSPSTDQKPAQPFRASVLQQQQQLEMQQQQQDQERRWQQQMLMQQQQQQQQQQQHAERVQHEEQERQLRQRQEQYEQQRCEWKLFLGLLGQLLHLPAGVTVRLCVVVASISHSTSRSGSCKGSLCSRKQLLHITIPSCLCSLNM